MSHLILMDRIVDLEAASLPHVVMIVQLSEAAMVIRVMTMPVADNHHFLSPAPSRVS